MGRLRAGDGGGGKAWLCSVIEGFGKVARMLLSMWVSVSPWIC